jgi:hypothetical protein
MVDENVPFPLMIEPIVGEFGLELSSVFVEGLDKEFCRLGFVGAFGLWIRSRPVTYLIPTGVYFDREDDCFDIHPVCEV